MGIILLSFLFSGFLGVLYKTGVFDSQLAEETLEGLE